MDTEDFAQWLTMITSNPWFELTSLMIGLIGIALAFIFYVKSKRERKPSYMVGSVNILSDMENKIEGLQVTYKGKEISNLSLSKLAFWNQGNQSINSSDVATSDPIRIVVTAGREILEAKILHAKNKANQIELSKDLASYPNAQLIHFEYLDQLDGAVIQVIHTGVSSKELLLEGTIKEAKLRRLGEFRLDTGKRRMSRSLFSYAISGVSLLFFIASITSNSSNKLFLASLGFFNFVTYFWVGTWHIRQGIPKGFQSFAEWSRELESGPDVIGLH